MTTTQVSLASTLFVLAGPSDCEDQHAVLKAENPEGRQVPIAFTSAAHAEHFARTVGLDCAANGVAVLEVDTESMLADLAAAHEPELHLDPLQAGETILRYAAAGTLTRRPGEEAINLTLRKPSRPLATEYIELLRQVARSLRPIERLWLLEVTPQDDAASANALSAPTRPLLVVEQRLSPDDENYDEVYMELGDLWCDALPPGMAVDMLPAHAAPVAEFLTDDVLVYRREETAA